MGSPRRVLLNYPFNLVRMGRRNGAVYRNLVLFAGCFWVYFTSLFRTLFWVANRFLRHKEHGIPHEKLNENPDSRGSIANDAAHVQEDDSSICSGPEKAADDVAACEGSSFDKITEESPPKFLSFKFPTFEEFAKDSSCGDDSTFQGKNFLSESLSEKNLREETGDLSPRAEDSSIDSGIDSFSDKFDWTVEFSSREGAIEELEEPEFVHEEKSGLAQENFDTENRGWIKEGFFSQEEVLKELKRNLIDDKDASEKFQFLLEKDLLFSDTDSDSMSSSHDFSIMSRLLDSTSDDFFSEKDLDEVHEHQDVNVASSDADDEDDESTMKELDELEQSDKQSHDKDRESPKLEEFEGKEGAEGKSYDKPGSEDRSELDGEGSNCDLLWEHQDLIEQLRMELKNVRATGLPTILEDCESPKIMEDLKPWKIDDKFQREEKMGELHKIYRSYRERMRKFDILNYQKMYALGFLRSKDPLKSLSSHKSTGPVIASLLSQSFKLCKEKKSENDPTMKFIRELHSDLEIVYVGQLCLSWEFLHWQYVRALELWDSDHYNVRRYNEVAGEFQQLQVLMQRFLENEQFEGPRVQYYVKTRCLMRNLLQVPVIREDSLKNKRMARLKRKGDYAINSDELLEILEESIRIFWQFIRADKDSSTAAQKNRKRSQPELQNPADLELLTQVQVMLQKKEKKLKELLRGGNCVLRKFQKHQEETSDQVLCFFSQVDMKLVRRVLNMSRLTTDQLSWCSSKLSKIVFVHRKLHIEPSFSLFPC
ncbi:hypothetical protein BT93_I0976 [Corymbia citriodora subsp. variegata]|nr:hypothetical protein BT93_I0976 [Corymbia citriodora subsp. variegata]